MEMSYIGTNQLKFTVTDRRIPSGIRMKPNIHIFGGLANQPGNTIIESRFVACDADRAIRKYSNDAWVAAYFGLHTEQLEDFQGYSAGYKYYTFQDERRMERFRLTIHYPAVLRKDFINWVICTTGILTCSLFWIMEKKSFFAKWICM